MTSDELAELIACTTPGCPGTRPYHVGVKPKDKTKKGDAHEPTLYLDDTGYCPACERERRLGLEEGTGIKAATESIRLGEIWIKFPKGKGMDDEEE